MKNEYTALRRIFNKLFAEEYSFYVHLNPLINANVPEHLRNREHVVLQVGASLPIPITKLVVDNKGFSCVMSFQGNPYHVIVPWKSVYAMVLESGEGYLFKQIPEHLLEPLSKTTEKKQPSKIAQKKVVSLADYKKEKGLS